MSTSKSILPSTRDGLGEERLSTARCSRPRYQRSAVSGSLGGQFLHRSSLHSEFRAGPPHCAASRRLSSRFSSTCRAICFSLAAAARSRAISASSRCAFVAGPRAGRGVFGGQRRPRRRPVIRAACSASKRIDPALIQGMQRGARLPAQGQRGTESGPMDRHPVPLPIRPRTVSPSSTVLPASPCDQRLWATDRVDPGLLLGQQQDRIGHGPMHQLHQPRRLGPGPQREAQDGDLQVLPQRRPGTRARRWSSA